MELLVVFIAGFLAAGIDGSLGMGFGPTSSALLLGAGVSPVNASAAVNVAKTGAGIAGAAAHWRFENVDRRLAITLAVPGACGALVGVTILSNVEAATLRPALAVLLIGIGLRVLWRFSRMDPHDRAEPSSAPGESWANAAVGAVGGCTNGMIGAWGPVVTPYLMHRGVAPRIAIGSVNTAEVAVAVVSAGVLIQAGSTDLDLGVTGAMLAGGVLAAPLAAHLVRRIPPRTAGLSLSALLLLTQTRELSSAAGLGPGRWLAYALVLGGVVVIGRSTRPRNRPVASPQAEALR